METSAPSSSRLVKAISKAFLLASLFLAACFFRASLAFSQTGFSVSGSISDSAPDSSATWIGYLNQQFTGSNFANSLRVPSSLQAVMERVFETVSAICFSKISDFQSVFPIAFRQYSTTFWAIRRLSCDSSFSQSLSVTYASRNFLQVAQTALLISWSITLQGSSSSIISIIASGSRAKTPLPDALSMDRFPPWAPFEW